MELAGKSAVVTGGGSGIGKAIAAALVQNGAKVAIASRNASRLKAAEAELGRYGRVLAVTMDVSRKEQVERGFAEIASAFERIDILVNNAGLSGMTRLDDPDDRLWFDILVTNLGGTYLATRAALRFMTAPRGGRIVNISSVLGRFGVPAYSAYCASKHGVIGFTKAAALELAPRGITVNAICPGWVDTEMARASIEQTSALLGIPPEEFRKRAVEAMPIKRFLEAEEIAAAVLFLCSPKASGITGQTLHVCGGQVML
jgi:NAD(P)-dependent dehydrogenase (short-subunit alcohol dehydrogenase family)